MLKAIAPIKNTSIRKHNFLLKVHDIKLPIVLLSDTIVRVQEDLTPERVVELVEDLRQGKKPKVGGLMEHFSRLFNEACYFLIPF